MGQHRGGFADFTSSSKYQTWKKHNIWCLPYRKHAQTLMSFRENVHLNKILGEVGRRHLWNSHNFLIYQNVHIMLLVVVVVMLLLGMCLSKVQSQGPRIQELMPCDLCSCDKKKGYIIPNWKLMKCLIKSGMTFGKFPRRTGSSK
jgi:hypothetical protein